jgi:hypothetical protein
VIFTRREGFVFLFLFLFPAGSALEKLGRGGVDSHILDADDCSQLAGAAQPVETSSSLKKGEPGVAMSKAREHYCRPDLLERYMAAGKSAGWSTSGIAYRMGGLTRAPRGRRRPDRAA